ncbi:MAG: hypothetical protein QF391_16855, partial [Myxococcota bacterium]|nr:hypothetical protein [Myxococcota bacterium]
ERWGAWRPVDAGPGGAVGEGIGRPGRVDGAPAVMVAHGAASGAYWAVASGGVKWAAQVDDAGGEQDEWFRKALDKVPPYH